MKRRREFNQKIKSMKLVIKDHKEEEEQAEDSPSPKQKSLEHSSIKDKSMEEVKSDKKEMSPVMRKGQSLHTDANGRELGKDYLRQLRDRDRSKLVSSPAGHVTASASLPSLKPAYKNYLTDLKLKRKPVKEEIAELKRSCMTRNEIYTSLTKKSEAEEQAMLRKISELKRLEKYEDSVKKEL